MSKGNYESCRPFGVFVVSEMTVVQMLLGPSPSFHRIMSKKFNLNMYPPRLRDAFYKGPMFWMLAIQEAKEMGYMHINMLTDFVFYLHHPELNGRPIAPGEDQLVKEWSAFKFSIKAAIGLTGKNKKKDSERDEDQDLIKSLSEVDIRSLVPADDRRSYRYRESITLFRSFVIRCLQGEKLDDEFWSYTYNDNWGVGRNAIELASVSSLKRSIRQRVMKVFRKGVENRSARWALHDTERSLAFHTSLVLKWASQNAGTGDYSVRGYREFGYLKELYDSVVQKRQNSVYWPYQREIVAEYHDIA